MEVTVQQLKSAIRDVMDFPQKGIVFKDITPILGSAQLFKSAIDCLANNHRHAGVDAIVGIDARGFIFSAAVAHALGVAFVPVRKKGKLPYKTHTVSYALEYGTGELEIHSDALHGKKKVVVMDDLLATGGTALAAAQLVEKAGGAVAGIDFLVELEFLKGRDRLKNYKVNSTIRY